MLRKCCQAQISPKFLKPEMRKHWQGSNFPKILKILASMGSAGAIVAQILGILERFDPCQCFRISSQVSGILGKFDPCPCFRIGGCPPPMIHCLRKAGSGGSWGGGVSTYIYIYAAYTCIYIYIWKVEASWFFGRTPVLIGNGSFLSTTQLSGADCFMDLKQFI